MCRKEVTKDANNSKKMREEPLASFLFLKQFCILLQKTHQSFEKFYVYEIIFIVLV